MSDAPAAVWPQIAVVMPVRDEADDLVAAVDSVLAQRYPGELSVWLAVGPSSDGTEAIAAGLAAERPGVHVVANPTGGTASGLNAAIRASAGSVVARVDAHAVLSPGYLERAVHTMRRTGAVNVGGVQQAVGATPFEEAAAAAMSSRFGTGDAAFHYGGAAGPTDTVYLGVFDRPALEQVGLFDESLVRNQDYELNIRLRAAGGTVWFDPGLRVRYRPRGSLRRLARQYFEYGQWKREVLRRHPRSLRWRQAVPPVVTGLSVLGLLATPWRLRAVVFPTVYAAAVVAAAASAGRGRPGAIAKLLAIFPTMHVSWSAGLVVGPRGRR